MKTLAPYFTFFTISLFFNCPGELSRGQLSQVGIVREAIARVAIVLGRNYRGSNCPGRGGQFSFVAIVVGGMGAVARGSIIQGGIALEPMFHVATF